MDRPFLPFLVLLFVGSGCAALIYEVVWLQMMSLIVGSSAVSLGVLLGTFMGGMCLGSLLLSKYVSVRAHPLRVYALLEAAIGIYALVIVFILPYVGGLYFAIAGGGMFGIFTRALFCAIFLLPPTMLMGATLPAISRWIEATPKGVSWLGFFYGGNIAGGVLGTLLAGYYLLRLYDVQIATLVAFLLNMAVAVVGLWLAKRSEHTPPPEEPTKRLFAAPPGSMPVYFAIGLSGMTALGAQVVWTRMLSLNLGATTYTFSLILAVFLFGLGIGSTTGAAIARNVANPRMALGWCQFLLMGCLAWAALTLTKGLPYWPIDPTLSAGPIFTFQMDLVKTAFVVLPGAILWGASFPLALASIGTRDQDPGVVVGTTYAANTVGAIFGSLLTAVVFIPTLGTQTTQRVLLVIGAVAALLMLVKWPRRGAEKTFGLGSVGAIVAVVAVGGFLLTTIEQVPRLLVGYGRFAARRQWDHGEFIMMEEGMNSSMTVSRLSNGVLNYHNAGKVQASSEPQDMRLQRMLGHMATLLPSITPERVLVIGCGAGVTAGAVSIDPLLREEVIAEIERKVPEVVSTYFAEHNYDVVNNPKVKVHIDDARHYLLTNKEKFDAITSDPFDPWVKGAASLYTKEFFQLIKDRLNDGGVVTVFVQLYESAPAAVKSEVATFLEVFPEGLIFGNTHYGAGYDVVLVGQKTPGPINVDAIQERLNRPEYAPVAYSLAQVGFHSAVDLLATFAARGDQLRSYVSDAQINLDKNLRLQYLAGFGLNLYEQAAIYSDMIRYRQYPEGLFTGSPEALAELRSRIY